MLKAIDQAEHQAKQTNFLTFMEKADFCAAYTSNLSNLKI